MKLWPEGSSRKNLEQIKSHMKESAFSNSSGVINGNSAFALYPTFRREWHCKCHNADMCR